MAVGFPENPINKKQFVVEKKVFEYNSELGTWNVGTKGHVSANTGTVADVSDLTDTNSILTNAGRTLPVYATESALLSVNVDTIRDGQMAFVTATNNIHVFYNRKWFGATTAEFTPPPAATWYGDRGVIGGGLTGGNSINNITQFDITTPGSSTNAGFLSVAREVLSATSDGTYALWFSGAINDISTSSNVIDYVTVATMGNAQDFGDVTVPRRLTGGNGALSDGTYGLLGGGRNYGAGGSNYNIIDYVTIATPGDAQDFGDLSTARYGTSGVSDGTYGVWGGGYGSSQETTIDYVTVATPGTAASFGNLTNARYELGAASNETRGLWAGGQDALSRDYIDYVTIATPGAATTFGTISAAGKCTGASNGTRAVFQLSNSQTIDYVEIDTTGNASDWGDNFLAVDGAGMTSGSAS